MAALSSKLMEEQMRILYYKQLIQYVSKKRGKLLMPEKWIQDTILKIASAKETAKKFGREVLRKSEKFALDNYEVLQTSNNKKVLAKKSKDNVTLKAIVPIDNSFHIVLKSHMETAHGSSYEMFQWLDQSKITVATMCIPILRECCMKITKVCIPGTVNGILNVMPGKRSRKKSRRPVTRLYYTVSTAVASDSRVVEIPCVNAVESSPTDANTTQITSQHLATSAGHLVSSISSSIPKIPITSIKQPSHSSILPQNQSKQFTTSPKPNASSIEASADRRQATQLPTALVTIIDMSMQPDNAFQYLLVYKDWKTQFVQLRPLTNTDLIEEITMELLKLLSDFAPPKCIKVQKNVQHIFVAVLDRLNKVFEQEILLHTTDSDAEMYLTACSLEVKLTNWMMSRKCPSWSIGCNEIQWEINNTKVNDTTPFENFFGLRKMVEAEAVEKRRNNEDENEKKKDSQIENITMQTDIVNESDTLEISPKKLKTVTDIEDEILTTYINKSGVDNESGTLQISQNKLNTVNNVQAKVLKTFRNETVVVKNVNKSGNALENVTFVVNNQNNEPPINKKVGNFIQNEIIEIEDTDHINTNVVKTKERVIFSNSYAKTVGKDSSDESNAKNIERMDTETLTTHSCCICELVIDTQVYFCYECKKALHQYCGASKNTPWGNMESVCFLCL